MAEFQIDGTRARSSLRTALAIVAAMLIASPAVAGVSAPERCLAGVDFNGDGKADLLGRLDEANLPKMATDEQDRRPTPGLCRHDGTAAWLVHSHSGRCAMPVARLATTRVPSR